MKVVKTEISKSSLLYPTQNNYDYTDSYSFNIATSNKKIDISMIADAFIKPGPKWFEVILNLRDKIVSVFGLKTSSDLAKNDLIPKHIWVPGEQNGMLKVFDRTADELILGEDDKHLNFKISLLLEQDPQNQSAKILTVTTAVILNNMLGRIYFAIIKPFHQTFVPILLKRNLESCNF